MPQARPGCLSETHELFVYYPANTERINRETNMRAGVGNATWCSRLLSLLHRQSSGSLEAAILPSKRPTTSTFTQATSPEETTIQLRTYLGSYISSPESILVLLNVFIDGVVSITGVAAGF